MNKEFLIYELPKETENIEYKYVSGLDDYKQQMKVKELNELLKGMDENMEVLVIDSNNNLHYTACSESGESLFTGACNEDGDLLKDEENGEDVKVFIISINQ